MRCDFAGHHHFWRIRLKVDRLILNQQTREHYPHAPPLCLLIQQSPLPCSERLNGAAPLVSSTCRLIKNPRLLVISRKRERYSQLAPRWLCKVAVIVCMEAQFMEVWASPVYASSLENCHSARGREFKSHRFRHFWREGKYWFVAPVC